MTRLDADRADAVQGMRFIATALPSAAWTVLWAVEREPYGRFLVHERLERTIGAVAAICRVAPQGDILVPAACCTRWRGC